MTKREKDFFERFDRHNDLMRLQSDIMQQMLDVMPKQVSKFSNVLEKVVLIVSIFGIIGVVEIIFKWIKGG